MTIGTSIMCGSLLLESLFFTFTCHTPPQPDTVLDWRGFDRVCVFWTTQTDDTEIRGSFRCGFYFGFYRGPHLVSNECGPLPESAWIDERQLRVRDSTRHR